MIHDSELRLTANPELADVLRELSAREPIFHRPEFGTSGAEFEKMTTPDFWEVGASGHRYSRQAVLDTLEKRYAAAHSDVWEAAGFHCQQLAPDVYLLTYTLVQDKPDAHGVRRSGSAPPKAGRSFTTRERSSNRACGRAEESESRPSGCDKDMSFRSLPPTAKSTVGMTKIALQF